MPICFHDCLLWGGLCNTGPGHGIRHWVQCNHTSDLCWDQLSPRSMADCLTAYIFLKASMTPHMALRNQVLGEPPPPPPKPHHCVSTFHTASRKHLPSRAAFIPVTKQDHLFIPLSKHYRVSAWNPPQIVSGKQWSCVYSVFVTELMHTWN